MKKREIKVEVIYTEGYERRFTEACLKQIELMEKDGKEIKGSGMLKEK